MSHDGRVEIDDGRVITYREEKTHMGYKLRQDRRVTYNFNHSTRRNNSSILPRKKGFFLFFYDIDERR